jgi:type II secretory pathway pseudopilin PulG
LVEVMLVVLILAVLASIALPRYAGALARYRAETAARRIVADLELAQAKARTGSASQAIAFDVARNSYAIEGMADLNKLTQAHAVSLASPPYQATLTQAALGNDARLVFNGYGVPDSGGTVAVRCGSVSKTVSIDATTGRATVQ